MKTLSLSLSAARLNSMLLASFVLMGSLLSSGLALAEQAKEPKAQVKVMFQNVKGSGDTLTFMTIPGAGLVVNEDGPWKLEIKSVTGVTTEVKEMVRSQWSKDIAGFNVPVKAKSKSVEVSFRMVTFVCTKDKSICYREVVQSTEKIAI